MIRWFVWAILVSCVSAEQDILNSPVGCFRDVENRLTLSYKIEDSNAGKNVDSCVAACLVEYFQFAALQNGLCFCGDSYNRVPGLCDMNCASNETQICGGSASKSVYRIISRVLDSPAYVKLLNATDTSLEIVWNLPVAPNVIITSYNVTAKCVETCLLPNLASLLMWEYPSTTTGAVLLNLHPDTHYNVAVAAMSSKGILGRKSASYWTEIGDPPVPETPEIISSSQGRMLVRLFPPEDYFGPVTAYYVVVIRDEDLVSLNPNSVMSYEESKRKGLPYYIAAEISPEALNANRTFLVGDNLQYGRYSNPPLPPDAHVHVALGVVSSKDNITKVTYSKVREVFVLDVGPDLPAPSNTTLEVGLKAGIGVGVFLFLLCLAFYFTLRRRLGRRRGIPEHQELPLEGPMIEVETNGFDHGGYVPDEEEWTDHYEKVKQQVWNIPCNLLDYGNEILGRGKYGNIMKGTVQQRGFPVPVAVYVIADVLLSPADKKSMLQDLKILIQTGSFQNVVNLVGTCETSEMLLVVLDPHPTSFKELLLGSRCLDHSSFHQQRFCSLPEAQIIEMAIGIACGMEYLANKKILHKQLATRNVIIDGGVPKVTNFGIASFTVGNENPDYTRWTAQEIFRSRHYVTKSDVWSFGCLLWEITALGGTPYVDVSTSDVPMRVMQGLRLPQIKLVADDLYQLMLQCWQVDLDERPSFQEIVHILENMLDNCAIHINFTVYNGFHYEQYVPELERL